MSKINRKMVILRIKFSTLDLGYKQRRDFTREKENFTNISQDLQKCGVFTNFYIFFVLSDLQTCTKAW